MRLTFFGSSIVSSYWNGAATYYRGLLRALHRRGYEITFAEPDAYGRQQNRDLMDDPDYARVVVYRTEQGREEALAAAVQQSDWLIKCSGVGVWDRELEEAVAAAGDRLSTAFLDVDAPATLARIAADSNDPFTELIPRFDCILTYGGGPPVVEAYERLGAHACVPIYNALDPQEHRPHTDAIDNRYDILFMGNRLPDRERRVDEFFFRAAELCPQARFALGGEGWGDRLMPPNVDYLGHVPTARHNEVNASARLILNIHRDSMVQNGWSPATRMFEAAGAGACQVTDSWEGIETFFAPGTEILIATGAEDVAAFVGNVGDDEARRIGLAARERALRDHTYDTRAERLDGILREPVEIVA